MKNVCTVNCDCFAKPATSIPVKLSRRGNIPPIIQGCSNMHADDNEARRKPGSSFLSFLFQCLFAGLALAITPLASLASDEHGRGSDPTGIWLTTKPTGLVVINTFHSDGTFSGDVQGESAFVPGNESPGF
jgi:hypothetical protein